MKLNTAQWPSRERWNLRAAGYHGVHFGSRRLWDSLVSHPTLQRQNFPTKTARLVLQLVCPSLSCTNKVNVLPFLIIENNENILDNMVNIFAKFLLLIC